MFKVECLSNGLCTFIVLYYKIRYLDRFIANISFMTSKRLVEQTCHVYYRGIKKSLVEQTCHLWELQIKGFRKIFLT